LADAASRCDRFHAVLDVGGVRVELRVGPLAPEAKTDRPAETYSEMEQELLAAIGDDTLTGQEIADKAQLPFDGSLRRCLAALRRCNVLGGKPGEPGYWVVKP
jgi:hypothetical protein